MNTAIQLVVSGVAIGSIYGLIALGFLIIHHATGIVNFAQANMLMIGGVASYLVLSRYDLGYVAVVPLVITVGVVLALVFNYSLVRPLTRRKAPLHSIVVGTIAFGVVLTEAAALVASSERHGVPPIVADTPVMIGGVSLLPQTLISVAVAWALVGAVWLFFNRTLTGVALRAVGINPTGAAVTGVNVPRLVAAGFILSIVITVIAGLLLAPTYGAGAHFGFELGVKGFAAAVLGGFGSVYRGMLAGVSLGVLELLTAYYVSSQYAPAIAYALLVVALCVQPLRAQVRLRRAT